MSHHWPTEIQRDCNGKWRTKCSACFQCPTERTKAQEDFWRQGRLHTLICTMGGAKQDMNGPLESLTCVITAHRRSHWIHFPKVEQLNRMLASKHQKLTGHIWFKWDQKEKHFPFDKNLKHLSNLNSLQGSGTTSSPIFYSNPSSITLSSINNNKKFPSGRILQIFSFLLFPCAHKSFSIELLFINLQQPWKEHDKKEFT